MTILYAYILGALITCSLLILRFNTTIVIHVLELLFIVPKEEYDTIEDLDNAVEDKYLMAKWPLCLVPELWECCLCQGVWIGAVVATFITIIGGYGFWFVPSCALSWVFFIWALQRKGAF